MLYNAVANGGTMMRPYLVTSVVKDGMVLKAFVPKVLNQRICTPATLAQLKVALEGVVTHGTGSKLLTSEYAFAGKTGTSLVADKGITYRDKMYQSSFAGYFPAQDPQFTVVVVIRNKAHATKFYGADVAGPVFRQVCDHLYAYCHPERNSSYAYAGPNDSAVRTYTATKGTLRRVLGALGLATGGGDRSMPYDGAQLHLGAGGKLSMQALPTPKNTMPSLNGFGLKDALELCEHRGLTVTVQGRGKVQQQSIAAGNPIAVGQQVHLQLN
jgi:cell division protein FtsI (penicillin-binding protein 3)